MNVTCFLLVSILMYYVLLNTRKGGELGSSKLHWDYDRCKEEAAKFPSRNDFKNNSSSAYTSAIKRGWLDDFFSKKRVYKNGSPLFWTHDKCKDEAIKYSTKTDFRKNSKGAYESARRLGWLDDFYSKPNSKQL